jgi:hypothetical protein
MLAKADAVGVPSTVFLVLNEKRGALAQFLSLWRSWAALFARDSRATLTVSIS